MKRGLVLEGGGAKGAYAFGCIKAFIEKGLKFDVISGTSVGSLNAALLSTNQIDKGDNIWKTLSQDRVYPWRRPKIVMLILTPFILLLNVFNYFDSGFPIPIWARRLVGLIYLIPLIAGFMLSSKPNNGKDFYLGILVAVIFILIAMEFIARTRHGNKLYNLLYWSLVSFSFGIGTYHKMFPQYYVFVYIGIIFISLFIIKSIFKYATFMHSLPLKKTIEELIKSTLNIKTFVTTAFSKEVFDPDKPTYVSENSGPDTIDPYCRYVTIGEFIPEYMPIDRMSDNDKVSFLLASAALPFGIVPNIRINEKKYIDGGIIDNTPIYPLIDENLDEVIIIRLNVDNLNNDMLIEKWKKINRLIRLSRFRIPHLGNVRYNNLEYQNDNNPPRIIPLKDPNKWPERVLILQPKESLGNILTGTLNFSSKYTKRLIDLGYNDAIEFINDNNLS